MLDLKGYPLPPDSTRILQDIDGRLVHGHIQAPLPDMVRRHVTSPPNGHGTIRGWGGPGHSVEVKATAQVLPIRQVNHPLVADGVALPHGLEVVSENQFTAVGSCIGGNPRLIRHLVRTGPQLDLLVGLGWRLIGRPGFEVVKHEHHQGDAALVAGIPLGQSIQGISGLVPKSLACSVGDTPVAV